MSVVSWAGTEDGIVRGFTSYIDSNAFRKGYDFKYFFPNYRSLDFSFIRVDEEKLRLLEAKVRQANEDIRAQTRSVNERTDQFNRTKVSPFKRAIAEKYNKNIVVERGMLLEAQVLQAIIDLAQANHSNTSPSMKGIAEQYNEDRTDKEHITAHKAGRVVGDRLKLEKVNKRGVYHLVWDGPKMQKLCERYGVLTEGVDFGGLVDFVDSLCEPSEKSTPEENQKTQVQKIEKKDEA